MAHCHSLRVRGQEPEELKNVRECTVKGEEEEDELVFVGVERVSEDADLVFVGVLSHSKPVISNILNRVTPGSHARRKKGPFSQDPANFSQLASYVSHTKNTVAIKPAARPPWSSGGGSMSIESPSEAGCKVSSPPVDPGRGSELLSSRTPSLVGAVLPVGGQDASPRESKQMSTPDINSRNPKRSKLSDGIPSACSAAEPPSSILPTKDASTPSKSDCFSPSQVQDRTESPGVCANDKAHFSLRDPDRANDTAAVAKPDCLGEASQNKAFDPVKGNLTMLLSDFYYGQHKGDGQSEQKTHTTFKCLSCLKVLKNIKFMNHMKHHLELERQRGDSWENHTTCRHCHRQFSTPFLLQCHIDSVHTFQEPSAICKICELSFETDQVLLQHMKDNHKPGEMPYVCQVCSYRSSAFVDVETHFRTCHENTRDLLCPFCLKLFKTAIPYMNHCGKHQSKKGFPCSKCRLQFLTKKEVIEHKAKNHKTFKKPEPLSGLSPETNVIIQTSDRPGSGGVASIVVSNTRLWVSPVKSKKRMAVNTSIPQRPL
ncbi:zinc finger protein 280A [Lepus europaeus]|uniref:zinc finger protein 280A n=1 Tax=Lepus europaeus TaxID=9983 RepID=UPI002B45D470|nr:zinc finger protein 280A [Lepus europaeus]